MQTTKLGAGFEHHCYYLMPRIRPAGPTATGRERKPDQRLADPDCLQRGQSDAHRFPARSVECERHGRGHLPGRRVLRSFDRQRRFRCRWLNAKGITGFVLKYRLVECKTDDPTRELMTRGKLDDIVAPVVKAGHGRRERGHWLRAQGRLAGGAGVVEEVSQSPCHWVIGAGPVS